MKILTAAEWLSESFERQELAVMNIPLAMELYAKYRETELSRPPKDVVEAIEKDLFTPKNANIVFCSDNSHLSLIEQMAMKAADSIFDRHSQSLRHKSLFDFYVKGAKSAFDIVINKYGYSLASGEAVAFGNWIMKSGYIEHNAGDAEWTKKWVLYTSDIDQEYVTTEQLYELFKKERNG